MKAQLSLALCLMAILAVSVIAEEAEIKGERRGAETPADQQQQRCWLSDCQRTRAVLHFVS